MLCNGRQFIVPDVPV